VFCGRYCSNRNTTNTVKSFAVRLSYRSGQDHAFGGSLDTERCTGRTARIFGARNGAGDYHQWGLRSFPERYTQGSGSYSYNEGWIGSSFRDKQPFH
jgi:hypothetical protein